MKSQIKKELTLTLDEFEVKQLRNFIVRCPSLWDNGEVNHTWQFGIVKNTSLLWVNYTNPGCIVHSSGGINILLSFFGSSLLCVNFQQHTFGLAVAFFTEYFSGWED